MYGCWISRLLWDRACVSIKGQHLQYHDWWWRLHVYTWYNLMEQNTPMHRADHTEMVISGQDWQHWCRVVMHCIILQHETTGGKWVNYTFLCTTSYNYMQTHECVQIQYCFKKYRGRCLLWDTVTFLFIVVRWGPFPAATLWICTVTYFYALVSPYPILLPPGHLIFWDIFIKIWQVFEVDTQTVGSMTVPEQRPATPQSHLCPLLHVLIPSASLRFWPTSLFHSNQDTSLHLFLPV